MLMATKTTYEEQMPDCSTQNPQQEQAMVDYDRARRMIQLTEKATAARKQIIESTPLMPWQSKTR